MCYVGIINITLINVSLELDVCSMTFILKLFSRFILELYVLVNVKISRCLIVHFLWRSPLIFWIKSLLIRISGLTLHYYTVSVYSSYSPSTLNKGFTRLNFVKSCQKLSWTVKLRFYIFLLIFLFFGVFSRTRGHILLFKEFILLYYYLVCLLLSLRSLSSTYVLYIVFCLHCTLPLSSQVIFLDIFY